MFNSPDLSNSDGAGGFPPVKWDALAWLAEAKSSGCRVRPEQKVIKRSDLSKAGGEKELKSDDCHLFCCWQEAKRTELISFGRGQESESVENGSSGREKESESVENGSSRRGKETKSVENGSSGREKESESVEIVPF